MKVSLWIPVEYAAEGLPAGWPAHLRADGTATGRRLAAEMGVAFPLDAASLGRL